MSNEDDDGGNDDFDDCVRTIMMLVRMTMAVGMTIVVTMKMTRCTTR